MKEQYMNFHVSVFSLIASKKVFPLLVLLALALSAARAEDIGQALPREGGSAALDNLAPHVAVDLTGPWLPPFGDFHTRLGARLALDFSFQPGAPGVLASTRGMPDSTLRSLICGIQDGGGAQHLLPLLGASNASNPNVTQMLGQRMTMQSTTYATKDDFTVTVSAPFERSSKLDPKSFAIRTQLSPIFFVTITATNTGTTTHTGKFLLGLDHVAEKIQGRGWTGLAFEDLPSQSGTNIRLPDNKAGSNLASTFLAVSTESGRDVVCDLEWKGLACSPGVVSVSFEIAPGKTASRTFVFSGFTDRPYVKDERDNQPLRLYYTTIWPTHQDLLNWTWANRSKLQAVTEKFDRSLHLESIPPAEQFVAVLGCRGYLENSGLTVDDKGRVYYAVFEAGFTGGYVNTLDLVPDTMVWDLNCHPWTLENVLRRYREYTRRDRYGVSFSHDMGGHNYAAKEKYMRDGGPNMATEQACNYLHATYAVWRYNGRDAAWLAESREIIGRLVESLIARDSDGDGIQDLVTDVGREGNTVDDGTDMGHNRNNHYMAIKELVAFAGAREMLAAAGAPDLSAKAGEAAKKIAASIHRHMEQHDRLWTDLDEHGKNHDAPNVHLLKGLFTAALTGMDLSAYPNLLPDCRKHLDTTLPLNAMFYGYPIVAHAPWLTWNSHSIMVDAVAKRLLGGPDMMVGERMADAFYFTGHANEFYNVRDPRLTNQWPKEQHYSRMAAAFGWLEAAQLKP